MKMKNVLVPKGNVMAKHRHFFLLFYAIYEFYLSN